MKKAEEIKISKELKTINESLRNIKKPILLEWIMLGAVIVSLLISIFAFNISYFQFNINKYEKEPRITFNVLECIRSDNLDFNRIDITLTNRGLLTDYNLKLETKGFKCAKDINGYSSIDYDLYNDTTCSFSFVIGPGPNQAVEHNYLLILNRTYQGDYSYNISYDYTQFTGNKKIEIIKCRYKREGSKFIRI